MQKRKGDTQVFQYDAFSLGLSVGSQNPGITGKRPDMLQSVFLFFHLKKFFI